MNSRDPMDGWIPFYLKQGKVHWAYMGRERFVEPFSQNTLQKLAMRPFNQLLRRQTELDVLLERAGSHPGLPLSGIVFHVGRCGSTLTAQALSALRDTVVLSEPVAFDTLLQWLVASPSCDADHGSALLRGLLSAMGQPRRANDNRLFIKIDCWHICHIQRILAAFPGVPWIFLYRDPLEVLVSQARMPGIFVVPGSLISHGLTPPDQLMVRPLEHGAWVLGQVLTAAADAIAKHPGGQLINYRELPEILETRLADHFQLHLEQADLEALRSVYRRDAKNPQQSFQSDSAAKHADASVDIKTMVARWMLEPYNELERLRELQLTAKPAT